LENPGPAEFRGEFRPIDDVPGLRVCEHLPRLARRAGKLALVRLMTRNDVDYFTAAHFLLTGKAAPPGPPPTRRAPPTKPPRSTTSASISARS
jgi:hypothetical protein